MRYLCGFLCVCAIGLMPMVGCDDDGGGGGTGGNAGTGGTAGTGGAGGSVPVTLSVTVTEAPSLEDLYGGPPMEGAELCQTDTANCDTTDADGAASIMLPADQEISYTVSKDGYTPFLVGDVTDVPLLTSTWPLLSVALLEAGLDLLEISYPLTGGIIDLASLPFMAGVTFDLVDETAKGYYRDEAGLGSLDLTATTSNGTGGFVEVSLEEYQVEFGGTATNCVPGIAWPGDAPNRIKVPVRVGYITHGSMDCDAP